MLAFDWNASGLTTILTAALKEAIRGQEKDLGIFICGGKGATSRKTPDEITKWSTTIAKPEKETKSLIYNSKMSAKVDSSLVQDGYQIYHHSFVFSRNGVWTVVQQGMNGKSQTARRYHWYSENVKEMVNEPHTAISAQAINNSSLNLASSKSEKNRTISTEISQNYSSLVKDAEIIRKHASKIHKVLAFKKGEKEYSLMKLRGIEFNHHPVESEKFWESKYLDKIFKKIGEEKPKDYESLLAQKGVGPKTIRAISLVAEIIYKAPAAYEDPARYSFAHGGKDATPYPVDKKTYDKTINTMFKIVRKTKLSSIQKNKIYKKMK